MRERRGEYENREGKEKSLKTDVPKLYAYNECEHSVKAMFTLKSQNVNYDRRSSTTPSDLMSLCVSVSRAVY